VDGAITSKLEIDVTQANEVLPAAELAVKYRIPALVVHQAIVTEAILAKGKTQGQFKIITPVDWAKGEKFGMDKMVGLSMDAIESDGFEIYLSDSQSIGDVRNEAKALTDFIKNQISPLSEIRFVLGTFSRDEDTIKRLCEGLVGIPTPAYLRTDVVLKLQLNRANPETHSKTIEMIKYIIGAPYRS